MHFYNFLATSIGYLRLCRYHGGKIKAMAHVCAHPTEIFLPQYAAQTLATICTRFL